MTTKQQKEKEMSKQAEKRAFMFHFFDNLRNRIKEKGIKIVIAKNIGEAKSALTDNGDAVLANKTIRNPQYNGWFCETDYGFEIKEVNGSIVINLPPGR